MHTLVSWRAYDGNGKVIAEKINVACFAALQNLFISNPGLIAKVNFWPSRIPHSLTLNRNHFHAPWEESFMLKWTRLLNKMCPEAKFWCDPPYNFTYIPPDKCTIGTFKLHMYLMRQPYNHPLVMLFNSGCPKFFDETLDIERVWQALFFLSTLPAYDTNGWEGIYDAGHGIFYYASNRSNLKSLKETKEFLNDLSLSGYPHGLQENVFDGSTLNHNDERTLKNKIHILVGEMPAPKGCTQTQAVISHCYKKFLEFFEHDDDKKEDVCAGLQELCAAVAAPVRSGRVSARS